MVITNIPLVGTKTTTTKIKVTIVVTVGAIKVVKDSKVNGILGPVHKRVHLGAILGAVIPTTQTGIRPPSIVTWDTEVQHPCIWAPATNVGIHAISSVTVPN